MPKAPRSKPVAPPPLALIPAGQSFAFTIPGAPRTKKNHQQIVRNKATGQQFIVESKSTKGWERSAQDHLRAGWHRPGVLDQPVAVRAVIYRERKTGDLLNYLSAVHDALEGTVLTNDKWIVNVDGSRLDKDSANPRVEIFLSTVAVE